MEGRAQHSVCGPAAHQLVPRQRRRRAAAAARKQQGVVAARRRELQVGVAAAREAHAVHVLVVLHEALEDLTQAGDAPDEALVLRLDAPHALEVGGVGVARERVERRQRERLERGDLLRERAADLVGRRGGRSACV